MHASELDFDGDLQARIYDYVERHGAASREEVRDAVRVGETPGSKPSRSGTEPAVRLPVSAFDDHVDALVAEGHLVERDGVLSLTADADAETYETDDASFVVRPARETDREALAALLGDVVDEGALVVDDGVVDAVERGRLLRRNDRESRTVLVAELVPDEQEGSEAGDDEAKQDPELVGWVHVEGSERPARSHTAELTVGVAPDEREQGIGGTLLDCGVDWAADHDVLKLSQAVPATNQAALDMLDAHGWVREAVRDDHYRIEGDLVDEVLLARRLDE